MTELEQRLLSALKRLESQYQERDRLFADTLNSLSKQLNDGAQRIETLNSQVTVLNGRIERLQTILTKR
jgi:chaperonin cofactor prefoldin